MFPSSGKKHLIFWTPYIKIFKVIGYRWSTHQCR